MKTWILLAAPLLVCSSVWPAAARASEFQVIGIGSANAASGSPAEVRMRAELAAKRRAVEVAIDKVLGPDSSQNPTVAAKLEQVMAQITDSAIVQSKGSRAGNDYQVTLTLILDDKHFRTLLSDLGLSINAAAVRSSALLAVMDEFLTSPKELQAPIEALEEFHHEAGGTFTDTSVSDSAAQLQASHPSGGQLSASQVSSDAKNVNAEQHDNVSYKKLIRYEPQGGKPEKTSHTYNALVGELQDYDLRIIDNDLFRSKYFKNKPVTIEELENSEDLARYVAFAKTDANADFFMVGTSILIDSGPNPSTGERNCSGVVTLKTYSTTNGESIASETASEAGAGSNLNDCAGNVAKKLARVAGASIGARVHNYWKRRATYGREYVLTLTTGQELTLMQRTAFGNAVKGVPGVESSTQRSSTDRQLQLVVSYKGSDPLDQAIASGLASNPAFSQLDSRTEGNQITLCMGPCSVVLQP